MNNATRKYNFAAIQGRSKAIKSAINLAQKVAGTDTTVLLLGETGTGKEVFAQAIHYESERKLMPFVALNCSGFSAALLETELFGYKAGAFTGAAKDKKGLLEEANDGTLFLDEIGELNLDLQAKLLRVLETQTYIKVGDTFLSQVNVRIIAATNRELKQEAERGKFRLDLYYRLSVFTITLSPLSQRKEDIPLIAAHYLAEFSKKVNKPPFIVEEEFYRRLTNHLWKGNIRELKNVIERVVILAEHQVISSDLLPPDFDDHQLITDPMTMHDLEKLHIIKVLKLTQSNKAETSRLLGIGLTTLYRKISAYEIDL